MKKNKYQGVIWVLVSEENLEDTDYDLFEILESLKNMNKADMKYPIFVAVNSRNEPEAVVDGNHRLAKAIRDKHSTIKTKFVTKELL